VKAPFEHPFDLSKLSLAEQDVRLVANPDECARIAQWAQVQSVQRFEATVTLRRLAQNRFSYVATLKADVVQSCVVSLEPVAAHVEKDFSRELNLVTHRAHDLAAHGDAPVADAEDENAPEEIESTRYDVARPLLEEFLLALDPYPRAAGVVFESPALDDGGPENPFAVLKALKGND
jgi:hypothetical protein